MIDDGKKRAEKMLEDLEKRIKAEYSQAAEEARAKLNKHLDDFARKDAVKQQQLAKGIITEKEYADWKIGQEMVGKRWEVLTEELTVIMTNADIAAAEMMQEHIEEVYAVNRNYEAYTIDVAVGYHLKEFTMVDKATVQRLLTKNPQLLPNPTERVLANVASGRAKLWERRQLQSVMLQSILQGESIPKIAKRSRETLGESHFIEEIKNANKKSSKQMARELERQNRNTAIRNARTMTTNAENAGRLDGLKQAEAIGLKVVKIWRATDDSRTRKSHSAIDGETIPLNEEFSNGLMFPADLSGPPEEVYNCRCTLEGDVDTSSVTDDMTTGQSVSGMSFEDWEEMMR